MAYLIKGARAVDPQVDLDAVVDVLLADDGTIAALGDAVQAPESCTVIDGAGKVLVPGLFDMHVHFRDPGQEYKETIEGGVRSAAKGGYTDVATMPNTNPVTDTGALIEFQRAKAQRAGLARVHPIGAITKGEKGEGLADIADMAAAGACAFSDDGRGVQLAGMMRSAMDYIAQFNLPVISHCQDESLVGHGVVNEGAVSTRLGLAGWPALGEEVQVDRDIEIARLTGCPFHAAHVTTAAGVAYVTRAKEEGADVTCEVCPHHLFLTEDDITDAYDTNYKMNPPLRTAQDAAELRAALCDGRIDCLVSDHAPHAPHEKDLEFERAPFGIVGLETELPLVLTHLVNPGLMTWQRLVEVTAINPRRICRLAPVRIEVGGEATLTLIDPHAPFTVTREFMAGSQSNTPFLGAELDGRATHAFVAGRAILENGEVVSQ
ncbi:MAG: dihydroorotase [Coriobacteriia bacterium]|nr:dihydroorotase [Coriobacteriia bacterium]